MDNITCKICGRSFDYLGSHIARGHKMTCREYKEQFGLDYKFPLISPEIKNKKQVAFEKNRAKYLSNFANSKKYRFKKGMTSKIRISEQSKSRHNEQLKVIEENKHGICPICHIGFEHLASHLYNKHGLVIAKR